jgi:hypothetical protein
MYIDVPDNYGANSMTADKQLWARDRKDVYRYRYRLANRDTLVVRMFYTIVEVNYNPDFDW